MDFNFNSINIMDQNNIILILLLIAVLVAFYAIYLAMENSKRIKKVSLEMVDLAKLIHESCSLQRPVDFPPNPEVPVREQPINSELDEYPSLEEVNASLNGDDVSTEMQQPLDESLKNEIDNLDNLSEEQLLNLERQLEQESDELESVTEVNGEEVGVVDENGEVKEQVVDERVVDENGEVVDEEVVDENGGVVDENGEEKDEEVHEVSGIVESASSVFPVLSDLTEEGLNDLNCDELREICKREDLRTRGRKAELVERILKKRDALA